MPSRVNSLLNCDAVFSASLLLHRIRALISSAFANAWRALRFGMEFHADLASALDFHSSLIGSALGNFKHFIDLISSMATRSSMSIEQHGILFSALNLSYY